MVRGQAPRSAGPTSSAVSATTDRETAEARNNGGGGPSASPRGPGTFPRSLSRPRRAIGLSARGCTQEAGASLRPPVRDAEKLAPPSENRGDRVPAPQTTLSTRRFVDVSGWALPVYLTKGVGGRISSGDLPIVCYQVRWKGKDF